MPKPISISARIAALEAAKRRIDALENIENMSSRPMADILDVTWPTLRNWCEFRSFEGTGAFVRGGNGIEWAFDPAKTVDTLLAHFRADMAERQDRNARIIASTGVELSDSEPIGDIGEIDRQLALTMRVAEMKEKQGRYIPAEQVREFLRGYNQLVIESIMGVRSQVDPTGQLPAGVAKAVNDGLIKVATEIQQKCTSYIGEQRAGLHETGVARAS